LELNTRTKKTTVNAASNIFNKIIIAICGFIVRTILIRTLGKEYVGINGLFSSIISILSLADLGIGIALPFSMYKPLAVKDEKKISALMQVYSKIYTAIGCIVLIIGLSLLPFLDNLINGETSIANIKFIYILFVINSAVSYLFVYKKTLIIADQKEYIVNRIANYLKLVLMLVQSIILIVFKNYIFYFSTNIIFAILENVIISIKCNKMYPYLREKQKNNLNKDELKEIWKNSYSLIFYKICNVVLGSTDNIIINYFCGINMVGIYSNYLLIIETLQTIINQIFRAITSSVGNLVSTENSKKSYKVFNNLNFLCYIVFGVCSICLFYLTNDFIKIWVGEEYLLSKTTLLVIVINFYLIGCQSIIIAFRTAYGLFWQGRHRPILAVIVNIVASIVLAKYLGFIGVLLGTTISRLSTLVWYDAYIVHKYGLKESVKPYYKRYVIFVLIFIMIFIIEQPILNNIIVNNYIMFVVKGMVIIIIAIFILIALFYKQQDFKDLLSYLKNIKK